PHAPHSTSLAEETLAFDQFLLTPGISITCNIRLPVPLFPNSQNLKKPQTQFKSLRRSQDTQANVKTAQLDAVLVKQLCCRICFKTYNLDESAPWLCSYTAFPTSTPCNNELFLQKKVFRGLRDPGVPSRN
ncbi:hypothetical protein VP01_535g1, partial [Puccinia sorghi]